MLRWRAIVCVGGCLSVMSCGRVDGILGKGSTTLASCRLSAPYRFLVTPLDSTSDSSFVSTMNAGGDIAGLAYRADGVHGMLWTASGAGSRDLGSFRPGAMNLNRDLAGVASFGARTGVPAFLPIGGAAQEIVAPSGITGLNVNDVNDNGEVLVSGIFFDNTSPPYGRIYTWKGGSTTLLRLVTRYNYATGLRFTTDGVLLYQHAGPDGIDLMYPGTGQVLAEGAWERAQISSAKDLVAVTSVTSTIGGPPRGGCSCRTELAV